LENTVYRFQLKKPVGWSQISKDQVSRLIGSVRLGASTAEELLKPVFGFSQYPLGMSKNKPNANIIALATKRDDQSDLCSSLVAARPIVKILIPSANYKGECREVDLNGNTFGMQELTMLINTPQTTYQSQYTVVTNNDYLITFTLTYFDTETKIALDNVIQSFEFF
jgi:hypothetical protein